MFWGTKIAPPSFLFVANIWILKLLQQHDEGKSKLQASKSTTETFGWTQQHYCMPMIFFSLWKRQMTEMLTAGI